MALRYALDKSIGNFHQGDGNSKRVITFASLKSSPPLPRKKMTQARAAHLTRAIFILIHSFDFLYETVESLGRQRFFKPREGNTREHFAYQDSSFFQIFKPTNSTREKILNVNVVVWKHDKQKNGSLSGCHPWPKSVACLKLPSDAKRPHLKSCRGRQNTTLEELTFMPIGCLDWKFSSYIPKDLKQFI